jgi:SAM-dependent methyltransferase
MKSTFASDSATDATGLPTQFRAVEAGNTISRIGTRVRPSPSTLGFEPVRCYLCGADGYRSFVEACDDLTGKPGRFTFVQCEVCGLVYQNPRIPADQIARWYDDEYIAHRKQSDFGVFTPLYRWAMDRHDGRKVALVSRYKRLDAHALVLDLGCGAGTFLAKVHAHTQAQVTGVDFKDLAHLPWMRAIDFRCGRPGDQSFDPECFDLITMWHFLEHDYEPLDTLARARDWLTPDGCMVIEVPRLDSASFRLFGDHWPGLQAPQHTMLYSRATLTAMVARAGLRVVDWLPWGAFPAYFYLFSGIAFKWLKGRGLNLKKAVYPYFIGELALSPLLLFEKQLNLAMQTIVVRKA